MEILIAEDESDISMQYQERLNVRVRDLKDHNVTHPQLVDLLAGVAKLQNMAK